MKVECRPVLRQTFLMFNRLCSSFPMALFSMALVTSSISALEIIGHRGASFDAPENTLSAIKLSFDQGADASELDVHLTQDGKIAVIHDSDLKRVAGSPLKVAETPLAEMQKFAVTDFGKWKGQKLEDKIPTLADVLTIVPAGKRLFIEIKCHEEIIPALAETFAGTTLNPKQLPIITFHYDVARAVKQRFPKHEVLWLHGWSREKENPTVEELIRKAKEANLDGLDLAYGFPINREFVKKVHDAGLSLYTWTVDDAAIARAEHAAGVDGITTNRPGWLREQLFAEK